MRPNSSWNSTATTTVSTAATERNPSESSSLTALPERDRRAFTAALFSGLGPHRARRGTCGSEWPCDPPEGARPRSRHPSRLCPGSRRSHHESRGEGRNLSRRTRGTATRRSDAPVRAAHGEVTRGCSRSDRHRGRRSRATPARRSSRCRRPCRQGGGPTCLGRSPRAVAGASRRR